MNKVVDGRTGIVRGAGIVRSMLLAGAGVVALSISGQAAAQDSREDIAQPAPEAPEVTGYGNEIVVTATKREQTLQDVPVAVSVTTAAAIERAQVRDLKDLSSLVPSLRVNQLQSSANTNFYIRGFGNGANNAGIEPSVGLFVDGVYRSRSASMITDLPDVQRVEVLKGPQSTLFGKNASAGVISIVTKKPQFTFGGNLEASYGDFNAIVLKGVLTGPISDTVAASLAAGYNKRDGFVKDLGSNQRENERNRYFVRGQLLFEPTDAMSIRLIGDYSKIDENCCAVVNIRQAPATGVLKLLNPGKTIINDPSAKFDDVIYNNTPSTNDIENYGVSGQIDYSVGPFKLTSITAYRRTNAVTGQDSDFTAADLIGTNFQDLRIRTFTQELRLATDLEGPFNALFGAFYFNEKVDQSNQLLWGTQARGFANISVQAGTGGALNVGGGNAGDLERIFGGLDALAAQNPALAGRYVGQFFKAGSGLFESYRLKDESYSLFSQMDFEVTKGLTVTGGVNYTHDSKTFSTNTVSNDAFSGVDFNAPQYAPFRNQLLFQGALAKTVGTVLNLGRSATAQEIGAFASNPATNALFNQIAAGSQAFATANQNNPAANPLNGLKSLQLLPQFLNVPNAVEPGKLTDGNFSYTARVAYQVTPTVNVYATYATGYKAASVNLSRDSRPTAADLIRLRNLNLTTANLTSGSRYADPETSTLYEFGLKGNWGVASANLAVFKQSIKGFQSNIFTGTGFFLANAGKQSAFGIEFDGAVHPTRELTLSLALAYLDPKYDSFQLSAFGNLTGTTPAGVSPLSATWAVDFDKPLANDDHIILHADYHYEAPFKLVEGLPNLITKNPDGSLNVTAALAAAQEFKQDINDVNASITYAMHNGLEISVWGRNLLNDRNLLQIFDSPAQTGSLSGYPNQPRTWGGSVRYRF